MGKILRTALKPNKITGLQGELLLVVIVVQRMWQKFFEIFARVMMERNIQLDQIIPV